MPLKLVDSVALHERVLYKGVAELARVGRWQGLACTYVCGQGHHGMLSSLDKNLQGSALSLHHVGLRDQTLSLVLVASSVIPRHPTSPPKVSHCLSSVHICLCVKLTLSVRTVTVAGYPRLTVTNIWQKQPIGRNCS